MTDIMIPVQQWPEFCDGFTRQHHGWLVGMRQLATPQLEGQQDPYRLPIPILPGYHPLQEVREGPNEILVTVGEGAGETSILIEDAAALYERRIGTAHKGLRVDSANGTSTLIEFRVAVAPEIVDGTTESELADLELAGAAA